MFPHMPSVNVPSFDAIIQIVFRDPENYLAMKKDSRYSELLIPDAAQFADASNTLMTYGWHEKHISN